jgi:hypothetical protein
MIASEVFLSVLLKLSEIISSRVFKKAIPYFKELPFRFYMSEVIIFALRKQKQVFCQNKDFDVCKV